LILVFENFQCVKGAGVAEDHVRFGGVFVEILLKRLERILHAGVGEFDRVGTGIDAFVRR
jgi:hypothetical protein